MGSGELLETYDPVGDETPRAARSAVARFARQHIRDDRTLAAIALCVSEAVSNVVIHAYRGGKPGPAILKGWVEDSGLWVAVVDHGLGLVPRLDSPGLGMGLPLIAQATAEADVRTGSGGTEVRMRFGIA